jgi:hypothetical protein
VVAEKPYITCTDIDGAACSARYFLKVPSVATNTLGRVEGSTATYPFEQVYVARAPRIDASYAEDLACTAEIQAMLEAGLHVVFSPGIYRLTAPLVVRTESQVLSHRVCVSLICIYVHDAYTYKYIINILFLSLSLSLSLSLRFTRTYSHARTHTHTHTIYIYICITQNLYN